MTKEDKELLLKDLCARLSYGVKVKTSFNKIDEPIELKSININNCTFAVGGEYITISGISFDTYTCKPYLFPLSSMTKEQEEEFNNLFYRYHESAFIFNERFSHDRYSIKDIGFYPCYLQDWLNKNHFDYRGLIEKGLAINATGLNIY